MPLADNPFREPKAENKKLAEELVEPARTNPSNKIVVFAKSYCPACRGARGKINNLIQTGVVSKDQVFIHDIDTGYSDEQTKAIQWHLYEKTKHATVPNIFVGQQHIGGNSDFHPDSDEIKQLLAQ